MNSPDRAETPSEQHRAGCVLMFSGGRDSTLAAVRLAKTFDKLVLATVTSDHLVGYERVHTRLRELRTHLPPDTICIRVAQPPPFRAETLNHPTCLPCHREYVTVGVLIARQRCMRDLAFGYVQYQDTWPEQTPYATSRLSELLAHSGICLHLPVQDITERQQAIDELVRLNISPDALEQKCLQQQQNKELPDQILKQEIVKWEESTRLQLERLGDMTMTILSEARLADIA